ncbi:hypothetical protein HAX54_019382 [Datura stramonium]|uniref:Uncharacterized protein n=1 Tax=Datura stramonium TaxID=4076 RepID=A0ABS8UP49_DATST|nr:hypothetical protein [Datura stramonium]
MVHSPTQSSSCMENVPLLVDQGTRKISEATIGGDLTRMSTQVPSGISENAKSAGLPPVVKDPSQDAPWVKLFANKSELLKEEHKWKNSLVLFVIGDSLRSYWLRGTAVAEPAAARPSSRLETRYNGPGDIPSDPTVMVSWAL